MLALGEICTVLLRQSAALSPPAAEELLDLAPGEAVRVFERPNDHVVSPDLFTGVDSRLPTASGARLRGVGTASSRVILTGGHVLQGSAFTRVVRSASTQREAWPHYLSRPGIVEAIGRADANEVTGAYIHPELPPNCLELGAIAERMLDDVQASPRLDQRPPFRAPRIRLRWVAVLDAEEVGEPQFTVESANLRTLHLRASAGHLPAVVALCEDLALHDWLLTTLLGLIRRGGIGRRTRSEVVERLCPAIDHLLHLWMPAARIHPSVSAVWESLERRSGLTRQWESSVNRVRDQVAASVVALLTAATGLGYAGTERTREA